MTDVTHLVQDLELVASTTPRLADLMKRTIAKLTELSNVVPENGVGDGEIPYGVIVELFNSTLSRYLPKALTKMPPMRRRMVAQRWQEDKERRSIMWWAEYWKRVSRSDFLTGRAPPRPGHENWVPNIDWFLKPSNMTKVLEGNYDNRGPRTDVEKIERFR